MCWGSLMPRISKLTTLCLYSLLYQQQCQIEELKRDDNERTDGLLVEVRLMNMNLLRITPQTVIRRVDVAGIVNPSLIVLYRAPPSLSSRPKDLYVLWKEYEFGIGGRKASKDFTYRERGGESCDLLSLSILGRCAAFNFPRLHKRIHNRAHLQSLWEADVSYTNFDVHSEREKRNRCWSFTQYQPSRDGIVRLNKNLNNNMNK
jgi:hypothetical protein